MTNVSVVYHMNKEIKFPSTEVFVNQWYVDQFHSMIYATSS
jgi:hypothetical protein